MSSGTERFSYRDGPYCRALVVGKVTGTAFSTVGTVWTPMISHTGAAQLCDPVAAAAVGQGSLDQMTRLVVSSCRDAGADPGSWDFQIEFSRLLAPEKQFSKILSVLVPIEGIAIASTYALLDTTLPRDFMKARTGTVTDLDELTINCEIRPSDDLIDTAVCFDIVLVPGNMASEDRGKLVPA